MTKSNYDKDTVFNFYLSTNGSSKKPMLIFKGTVDAFQKVEQLYAELWYNVIDKQLGLLDFDNGYPVDALTDDPILLQWEGCDIEAIDLQTQTIYCYLGDGKLVKTVEPEEKPKINHNDYPDDVNYQVEQDKADNGGDE
jgi:hypothetical protein